MVWQQDADHMVGEHMLTFLSHMETRTSSQINSFIFLFVVCKRIIPVNEDRKEC